MTRIAILGAGPMGLGAAYQLVQEGYAPVVYEADDRVGGMAASFDFHGTEIERYYHFHVRSDHTWREMCETMGLSDRIRWVTTTMGYWYENNVQKWGSLPALFKFQGLSLSSKIRCALHAALSIAKKEWNSLDGQRATLWLRKYIGEEAYHILWHPLFAYKFYEYADELSAAWIWRRMHRVGRSRNWRGQELLGYLEGGSKILLEAMRREIEAKGGKILLRTPVSKVCLEGPNVVGVEAGGHFYPHEKLFSTLPVPYVPKLIPDLPPEIGDAFRALRNLSVACLILRLRKPLTPHFWLNIHDPTMDCPGIITYSHLCPMEHPIAYVPFYLPETHPDYAAPDTYFYEKVKRYCLRIQPSLTEADFLNWSLHRYRYAQPLYEPRFAQKLPPVQLPIRGLWVADTSYYYPEDRGLSESLAFGREIARKIGKETC